jgi:hypothetical protein
MTSLHEWASDAVTYTIKPGTASMITCQPPFDFQLTRIRIEGGSWEIAVSSLKLAKEEHVISTMRASALASIKSLRLPEIAAHGFIRLTLFTEGDNEEALIIQFFGISPKPVPRRWTMLHKEAS